LALNHKYAEIVKTWEIVQNVCICKAFLIFLFVYHSENFQKCNVCARFDFISCLSSEEESLHALSKHKQLTLRCYHTSESKFAASRLYLVTETAYYVHIVLALR